MLIKFYTQRLKTQIVVCLILLFTANYSIARDPSLMSKNEVLQVEKVRDIALESKLSFDILESLTTEVGPRMAGTKQDLMAVDWAVKNFKALGFDKVWKEPVTYPTWVRGVETAEVISPYPQPLHITALGGSVATPKSGVTAAVVHFENLEKLKQTTRAQVKGKIVFVSNKMKRTRNGQGYGSAAINRREGAVVASQKGALALIIRSVGTDTHRVPHTGLMGYKDSVKKIPAAALSNPDADQLVRIFARKQPVTINLNIGSHPAGKFTSYNVIGEISGSKTPQEYVIIGGHLDSWDLGTGAVDDGCCNYDGRSNLD